MIDPALGAPVLGAVAIVLPVSAALYARGAGRSDFTAAARPLPLLRAAATVGGELVSAAAFLGVAGLLLAHGTDGMWVVSALGVGYVLFAILVAAPLRRSGVYSPSDFAEWRLGSRKVRRLVSACVVVTGWMYLMSQFAAAALLARMFAGLPGWVGWVVLLAVTLVIVLGGGAGSGFQALHFWIKLLALALPVAVLAVVWLLDGPAARGGLDAPAAFPTERAVHVAEDRRYRVEHPTRVRVTGELDGRRFDGAALTLRAGVHDVSAGAVLSFAAGEPVPRPEPTAGVVRSADGSERGADGAAPAALSVLSVFLALALGLTGTPQFIGRISATRGGDESRWLALAVMALLGVFLLAPLVFGGLGRVYAADLVAAGRTDELVLELPGRIVPGPLGDVLTAVVGAGAAIAVITVCAALCRALGGTISQCMLGGGSGMFRFGVVLAVTVPVLVLMAVPGLDRLDVLSPLLPAFQLSAVTVAPLLLLGLWWRGLTDVGAALGLAAGLLGTAASVAAGADVSLGPQEWAPLVRYPVPVLLPLVFAIMVGGSLLTRRRRPGAAGAMLVRMHVVRVSRTESAHRASS